MKFYLENMNKKGTSNTLNRNTIKRIKKMIVAKEEKYEVLKDKFLGGS
jgi:hypothetical protein